jgi:hypothetical protein
MKKIKFAGILFFAIFTACSSAAETSVSSNASRADYSVSQSSGTISNAVTTQNDVVVKAQKVSLEQSEQTQIAPRRRREKNNSQRRFGT